MNHEDIQELFLEINQELDSVEEISVNFIATKSAAKKLFVIRKIMKSVYDLDDETIDKYIFTKGINEEYKLICDYRDVTAPTDHNKS